MCRRDKRLSYSVIRTTQFHLIPHLLFMPRTVVFPEHLVSKSCRWHVVVLLFCTFLVVSIDFTVNVSVLSLLYAAFYYRVHVMDYDNYLPKLLTGTLFVGFWFSNRSFPRIWWIPSVRTHVLDQEQFRQMRLCIIPFVESSSKQSHHTPHATVAVGEKVLETYCLFTVTTIMSVHFTFSQNLNPGRKVWFSLTVSNCCFSFNIHLLDSLLLLICRFPSHKTWILCWLSKGSRFHWPYPTAAFHSTFSCSTAYSCS